MKNNKVSELKFINIPPNISQYERKINLENFYNTYSRILGLNEVATYDPNRNTFIVKTAI